MKVAKKSSKAAKRSKVSAADEKRAAMKAELTKKAEAEAVLAAEKKAKAKRVKKVTSAAGTALVKDETEREAMADLGIHGVFRDSKDGLTAVVYFNSDPEAKAATKNAELVFDAANYVAAEKIIAGLYAAVRGAVDARYTVKKSKK